MKNQSTRVAVLKRIGQLLKNEVAQICSDIFQTLTRSKEKEHFQDFNDMKKVLLDEMEKKIPALFSLLTVSLRTRHQE